MDIGAVYRGRGELHDAMKWYKMAKYMMNNLGPGNRDKEVYITVAFKIAKIERRLGHLDAALAGYTSVQEVCFFLYGDHTAHQKIASLYNSLGVLYFYKGDLHQAKKYFQIANKMMVTNRERMRMAKPTL